MSWHINYVVNILQSVCVFECVCVCLSVCVRKDASIKIWKHSLSESVCDSV